MAGGVDIDFAFSRRLIAWGCYQSVKTGRKLLCNSDPATQPGSWVRSGNLNGSPLCFAEPPEWHLRVPCCRGLTARFKRGGLEGSRIEKALQEQGLEPFRSQDLAYGFAKFSRKLNFVMRYSHERAFKTGS
jgi:hypothetical protein